MSLNIGERLSRFRDGEWGVFARHVRALLDPSSSVESQILHTVEPNPDVHKWDREKRKAVSELAKDELADLNARFESVRGKAQVFFAINLAFGSVLAAFGRSTWIEGWCVRVLWGVAFLLVVLGTLGQAATYAVTAPLGSIDAVVSSNTAEEDFEQKLLDDRLTAVRTSMNALFTRRSVSDNSVRLTVWGALIHVAVWVGIQIPL